MFCSLYLKVRVTKGFWNEIAYYNFVKENNKASFGILLISLFYICKFFFLLLLFPLLFYQFFLFIPAINNIIDTSDYFSSPLTWWACPDPSSASYSASASPPCAAATPRGYRMSSQNQDSRSEWRIEILLTFLELFLIILPRQVCIPRPCSGWHWWVVMSSCLGPWSGYASSWPRSRSCWSLSLRTHRSRRGRPWWCWGGQRQGGDHEFI